MPVSKIAMTFHFFLFSVSKKQYRRFPEKGNAPIPREFGISTTKSLNTLLFHRKTVLTFVKTKVRTEISVSTLENSVSTLGFPVSRTVKPGCDKGIQGPLLEINNDSERTSFSVFQERVLRTENP